MAGDKIEVKAGQIWRRNEYLKGEPLPCQLHVVVLEIDGDHAVISTCAPNGRRQHYSRSTRAQLKRFGRRGGYAFVREA
jgi:hypothetical protein